MELAVLFLHSTHMYRLCVQLSQFRLQVVLAVLLCRGVIMAVRDAMLHVCIAVPCYPLTQLPVMLLDISSSRLHSVFPCAAAAIIRVTGKLEACHTKAMFWTSLDHEHIPSRLRLHSQAHHRSSHAATCRALCIGVGGGSLPHFLSHHFPGMLVDAVELDPVVVSAAVDYMGLPHSRYSGPSIEQS